MAIKLFTLFIIFNSFLWAQSNPIEEKELEVAIGIDEIQKIDFDYNTKVSIGNESLLKLTLIPQKREVVFKGIKPGKTTVTFRDNVGDVRLRYTATVTSSGNSSVVTELRDLIGDIEGIEISIKGGKVVVHGEIVVPDEIGRLNKVLAGYGQVLSLVELSSQTQRVIARRMMDEMSRNNLKDVSVRVVNKVFWLEGIVGSDDKKKLAQKIAESYLPPKVATISSQDTRYQGAIREDVINFLAVDAKKEPQPTPKMVKVTAQFVELDKGYNKIFGFKWAPLMGDDRSSISIGQTEDGGVSSRSNGTLSATISSLFPKLLSAKNANYARVIQSGMVVMRNEQKGVITKSTAIPFAIGSGEQQRGTETRISFNLDVTPRILEQEQIEMGINLSVSLPAGKSDTGAPLSTENSVSTNLVLKSKESAAIGGIVQTNVATSYDNDPFAGAAQTASGTPAIPLFQIIRSKDYTSAKNQYVMFVTPEIIESASVGTEEIVRKFRRVSN